MRRAGITNTGSSTSASSVICHDRPSITASVSTSVMTLLTTPDSVQVKARWAPITSLFEPADEGAGAGAGEEGDRHALHVAEHGPAQVEDQPLADPGRLPALGDADRGVEQRR